MVDDPGDLFAKPLPAATNQHPPVGGPAGAFPPVLVQTGALSVSRELIARISETRKVGIAPP